MDEKLWLELKSLLERRGARVGDAMDETKVIPWREAVGLLVPGVQEILADEADSGKVRCIAKFISLVSPPAGLLLTGTGLIFQTVAKRRNRDERDKEVTQLFSEAMKTVTKNHQPIPADFFTRRRIKAIYGLGFGTTEGTAYEENMAALIPVSTSDEDMDNKFSRTAVECALYQAFSIIYKRSLGDRAFASLLNGLHWYLMSQMPPPKWWWTGFWQQYGEYLAYNEHSILRRHDDLAPKDYIPAVFTSDSTQEPRPMSDGDSGFDAERFAAGEEGVRRFIRISADPGMGKTALVGYMLLQSSQRLADLESTVVPIPCFFQDPNGNGQFCPAFSDKLLDYLVKMPLELVGNAHGWAMMKSALRRWWENGLDRNTILLLDGFDYFSPTEAGHWVGWVLQEGNSAYWSPRGPKSSSVQCRVLVTGRPWVWQLRETNELNTEKMYKTYFGHGFDDNGLRKYLGGYYDAVCEKFGNKESREMLARPLVAEKVREMARKGEKRGGEAGLKSLRTGALADIYDSILEFTFKNNEKRVGNLEVEDCWEGWMRLSLFQLWRDRESITESFSWRNDKDLTTMISHWSSAYRPWASTWLASQRKGDPPALLHVGLEGDIVTKGESRKLFRYSHLTFKEYLAGRALVKLDDVSREAPELDGVLNPIDRMLRIVRRCHECGDVGERGLGIRDLEVWSGILCLAAGHIDSPAERDKLVEGLLRMGEIWLAGRIIVDGGMEVSPKWSNLLCCLLVHGGGDSDPGRWYTHETSVFETNVQLHALDLSSVGNKKDSLPGEAVDVVNAALDNLHGRYEGGEPAGGNRLSHTLRQYDPLVVTLWDLLEGLAGTGQPRHQLPFPSLFARLYEYGYQTTYQKKLFQTAPILGAGSGWRFEPKRPRIITDAFPQSEKDSKKEEPNKDAAAKVEKVIRQSITNSRWRQERTLVERTWMLECLRGQAIGLVRSYRLNERDAALAVARGAAKTMYVEPCSDNVSKNDRATLVCLMGEIEYALAYGEVVRQQYRAMKEKHKDEWNSAGDLCKGYWQRLVDVEKLYATCCVNEIEHLRLIRRGFASVLYHFCLMRNTAISWKLSSATSTGAFAWRPEGEDLCEWMPNEGPIELLLVACIERAIALFESDQNGQEHYRSLLKARLLLGFYLFPLIERSGDIKFVIYEKLRESLNEAVKTADAQRDRATEDLMLSGVAYGNRGICQVYWAGEKGNDLDRALEDLDKGLELLAEQSRCVPEDEDCHDKRDALLRTAGKIRDSGSSPRSVLDKMLSEDWKLYGNLLLNPELF
ncbi:MAG: hypothetical protein KJ626_04370 [Verrucomicrobia bacterium]|nr:hypothetical protein [Verrucomicrobiota bacterium]